MDNMQLSPEMLWPLQEIYTGTSYTGKNLFHVIHFYVGFFPNIFFPALILKLVSFLMHPCSHASACCEISLAAPSSQIGVHRSLGWSHTYMQKITTSLFTWKQSFFFSILQHKTTRYSQSVLWNTILLQFSCTIGVHMHICTSTAKFSLEKTTELQN